MSGYACVDANIVAKWLFTEADSPTALALLDHLRARDIALIAPPHLPVEVTNVVRVRLSRGEVTLPEAEDILDGFVDMPIRLASPPGLYRTAVGLAQQYNRPTVYDTQYVALAGLAGCDFWTADMRLVNSLDGRIPFVRPLHTFTP